MDAHTLADMVRTDAHQLREVAGDSALAEGVKVIARAHQTTIWDRQRHVLQLRSMLREYFPAALEVFEGVLGDLAAADALALLDRAPDPEAAARPPRAQIAAVLKQARRRESTPRRRSSPCCGRCASPRCTQRPMPLACARWSR